MRCVAHAVLATSAQWIARIYIDLTLLLAYPLSQKLQVSVIAENTPDEQRKFIKYNHLVANLLVFHNIVTLSRAFDRLQADGLKASA